MEYAGGPRVGAQEEEIRPVKGLRPERVQQLTCLLLAALSQQGHGMEVGEEPTTGNEGNRGLFLMVFTANAVLMVAMMMAMSVQGCDLALMVLNTASVLPDLADWRDDGGVQCLRLHPVLPQGLPQPTTC